MLALHHGANTRRKMFHDGVFQYHATGAQLQRLQDLPLVDQPGQDDGAGRGGLGSEFAQGIHARHLWHGQVQQQDVGPVGAHHVERLDAVLGLRHDLHLGVGLQHVTQTDTHHRMIVGNQDLDGSYSHLCHSVCR